MSLDSDTLARTEKLTQEFDRILYETVGTFLIKKGVAREASADELVTIQAGVLAKRCMTLIKMLPALSYEVVANELIEMITKEYKNENPAA